MAQTKAGMMQSFMDAYALWRRLPFPRTSRNKDLILVYGDLAVADEYVTCVISFVEDGIFTPAPVNVLELLEEIMSRIKGFDERLSIEDRKVADAQYEYAALLHRIYEEFLKGLKPGPG